MVELLFEKRSTRPSQHRVLPLQLRFLVLGVLVSSAITAVRTAAAMRLANGLFANFTKSDHMVGPSFARRPPRD